MTGKIKKILECIGHGATIVLTALDTYAEYRRFHSKQKKKNKKDRKRGKRDGDRI